MLEELCKPLCCKLCNVTLNSAQQAQAHYQVSRVVGGMDSRAAASSLGFECSVGYTVAASFELTHLKLPLLHLVDWKLCLELLYTHSFTLVEFVGHQEEAELSFKV